MNRPDKLGVQALAACLVEREVIYCIRDMVQLLPPLTLTQAQHVDVEYEDVIDLQVSGPDNLAREEIECHMLAYAFGQIGPRGADYAITFGPNLRKDRKTFDSWGKAFK